LFFRRLIAEAERRHREVQQKLEQGEEERQTMTEKYTSIKEEVDDKRAKRDKLSKQMKKVEGKKADIIEKHRITREELEAEQREIQKQTKLFQLIIENFIPIDEQERLAKRIQFDDEQSCWSLKELSKQT
jgi:kinesin family protein 3/17